MAGARCEIWFLSKKVPFQHGVETRNRTFECVLYCLPMPERGICISRIIIMKIVVQLQNLCVEKVFGDSKVCFLFILNISYIVISVGISSKNELLSCDTTSILKVIKNI